jgi:hypothetical protein
MKTATMSAAEAVFERILNEAHGARSEEFREGLLDALRERLDGVVAKSCRYPEGSAQADAYFAGANEGALRANAHLAASTTATTASNESDFLVKWWRELAYPLQTISICLQGTKLTPFDEIVGLLQRVNLRLRSGDERGEESDDEIGYRFEVRSSNGPSLFHGGITYE